MKINDLKFFLLIIFSLNLHSVEFLTIEDDFKIEVFVSNIDTPRQIAESDAGNIFVGSRSGGTVSVIDANKNIRVIAEGLSNSTGVTYHNGDLYFSEVSSIWMIENIDETGMVGNGLTLAQIISFMFLLVPHAIFVIPHLKKSTTLIKDMHQL